MFATRVLKALGHDVTTKQVKEMDPRFVCLLSGLPFPTDTMITKDKPKIGSGKKIFANIKTQDKVQTKRTQKKGKEQKPKVKNQRQTDIFFEGHETCHLHVDKKGLKRTLQNMFNINDKVIDKPVIKIKYELEFDNGPYIKTLKSTSGFTRKLLAKRISQHYEHFFKYPKKYGLYIDDLSSIGINAISYNSTEDVYEMCIDLTH